MRNSIIKAYALGMITGSFFTAGAVLLATPAKADITADDTDYYSSAVCNTLDSGYATLNGILGIGQAIHQDGYTYRDAGAIIADSVIGSCPEYVPLLKRFADRYSGSAAA